MKSCNLFNSTTGFTLVELLIASFLSFFVLSAAGLGLVTMTEASQKAEKENIRQLELNRALDFIVDEVRMSEKFLDPSPTIPGFTQATGVNNVKEILAIKVPGLSNPIVYYIAQPPNSSVWSGKRVIYRWGPSLNLDGTYSPSAYQNEVLVDFISDQIPNPNPDCPTNTTAYPTKTERTGFYICKDNNNRIADIYLHGESTGQIKTKVFARSAS